MKKKIFSLLFSCFAFGALPVSGQQSVLLEKYRTMRISVPHIIWVRCKCMAKAVRLTRKRLCNGC